MGSSFGNVVAVETIWKNVGKNAAEWFIFSQTQEICIALAQDQEIFTFAQGSAVLL